MLETIKKQKMKNLFNENDTKAILARIDNLKSDSPGLWGKMTVDQMLAHCTAGFEMASGKKNLPRPFLTGIIGFLLKKVYSNEQPFRKNSPTAPSLIITDHRDFEAEKQKLKSAVIDFQAGGEKKCTTHPHPFFGKLTPTEWSIGVHKHLDHHLRQFGV